MVDTFGLTKNEIINQVSQMLDEQLLRNTSEAELNSPQVIIKLTGVILGALANILEQNNQRLVHDLISAGLIKPMDG